VSRNRTGVLVVIGGASGIGQSLVAMACEDDWTVAVIDRASEPERHPAAAWFTAEARDRVAVVGAFREILDRWGEMDALVITAGIADPAHIGDIAAERVEEILDVNVTSAITTLTAASSMLSDGAAVVLFSSVAAHRGGGFFGASTYAASKGALESLTRAVARELGPRGIRVNCIAPGPTATPMLLQAGPDVIERVERATFLNRLGQPDEIAEVALFLIGRKSSFMTGAVVTVDGGSALK
jgi:3-oxoacyl-[acyl-carrier protein] reductase